MAVDEFFDEDMIVLSDDLKIDDAYYLEDDDYCEEFPYLDDGANDLYSDLDGWDSGLRWDDGS